MLRKIRKFGLVVIALLGAIPLIIQIESTNEAKMHALIFIVYFGIMVVYSIFMVILEKILR